MPTFTHGKKTKLFLNTAGTAGAAPTVASTYNISDNCKEVSFPSTMDTAETSTFGSDVKTYVQGLRGSTISVSGSFEGTTNILDGTSANGKTLDQIFSDLIGAATNPTFAYGPTGSETGKVKYSGTFLLTSYQITGSIGDLVAFSAEFQVSGTITRGVF